MTQSFASNDSGCPATVIAEQICHHRVLEEETAS